MHEEQHKPKSFRGNTFSRFAKTHDISVASQPIDRYGVMEPDKLKEARNFQIILNIGPKTMFFTMSFPEYRRYLPSVEDVLEYMSNEVAVFENFGTDAQAFAIFSDTPLEEASRHVEEAATVAPAIRTMLGPEIYRELARITEDLR